MRNGSAARPSPTNCSNCWRRSPPNRPITRPTCGPWKAARRSSPENQRELIDLRYQPGYSLEAHARETGKKAGTLRVALLRIRAALRECVEQNHEGASGMSERLPDDLQDRILALLDGTLEPDEVPRLDAELRTDPEARALYRQFADPAQRLGGTGRGRRPRWVEP